MPAPFITDLCGYRHGRPNTSDKNDPLSVELGNALFERIGVPRHTDAPADVGRTMEEKLVADLQQHRPDMVIARGRAAVNFEQFEHLGAIEKARQIQFAGVELNLLLDELVKLVPSTNATYKVLQRAQRIREKVDVSPGILAEVLDNIPKESLLKLDLVVSESGSLPELFIGASCKWTLRTDRAQDCISQGHKLVSLRRGRMPHYAAITMEPRPAMLRLLADGSGAVDCVYHLDLVSLQGAVEDVEQARPMKRLAGSWSPGQTLERLCRLRRLRDYDDLVRQVMRCPHPPND
jgi:hypothetical protein